MRELVTSFHPPLIKENVADFLRTEIISGRLKPGDPIVEGQWAKKLNVAQASVRAALDILKSEGFAQRGSGRSLIVTAMTPEEIVSNFQVREVLEIFSARLVSQKKPNLSELDQIVADMQSAVDLRNLQAFYQRDLRFHLTLCRLAGNPVLERMLTRLLVPLFAFVIMRAHDTMDDSARWPNSVDKHRQIVKALREDEVEVAVQKVSSIIGYFSGDISELTLKGPLNFPDSILS